MPTKSNDFYKKGDIVDAPFPYQIPQDDSEEEKYRPVLILAPAQIKGGFICAYITSKSHRLGVVPIFARDFKEGTLSYDPSYIQPSTVYTVDAGLIRRKYGTLKDDKVDEVIKALVDVLQKPSETPPTAKAWERPKKNY
jgi:mRNA interferase MazF